MFRCYIPFWSNHYIWILIHENVWCQSWWIYCSDFALKLCCKNSNSSVPHHHPSDERKTSVLSRILPQSLIAATSTSKTSSVRHTAWGAHVPKRANLSIQFDCLQCSNPRGKHPHIQPLHSTSPDHFFKPQGNFAATESVTIQWVPGPRIPAYPVSSKGVVGVLNRQKLTRSPLPVVLPSCRTCPTSKSSVTSTGQLLSWPAYLHIGNPSATSRERLDWQGSEARWRTCPGDRNQDLWSNCQDV